MRNTARDAVAWSRPATTTLLVALGLAGCHGGRANHGHEPADAAANGDGLDAGAAGAGPSLDAEGGPDVSTGGGADLGGEPAEAGTPATDPTRAFHRLLADINDAFYGNYAVCFGSRRSLWPGGDFSDLPVSSLDASLRLGLLALDAGTAARCLETLRTAPCERLLEIGKYGPLGPGNPALPECAQVLLGQVPPGKTCRIHADCQDPDNNACAGSGICGRVCTARTVRAAGDRCGAELDRCPEGTACRYGMHNSNERRCLGPEPRGGACRENRECAAGLLCAQRTATSIFDGTCQPFALGSPCAGNWECAYSYVCAGAGPDRPGTCQVGKPVGATCATYLQDVNRNLYSDCAVGTECLDVDGQGPRCSDGAALGEACGTQPGPYSGWLGCREGFCDRGLGNTLAVGICRAKKEAGAACSSWVDCAAPHTCLRARDATMQCGLPDQPAPLGSPCAFGVDECGPGQYCALPASVDETSPLIPTTGSCARAIPAGQACRAHLDLCEGLAACAAGVCQPC